jgi:hypothetical protein
MKKWLVPLSIFLLILPTLIGHDPEPPHAPVAVTAPKIASRPHFRTGRWGVRYPGGVIEKRFRESRLAFAKCFIKDPSIGAGRIELLVRWYASGALDELTARPAVSKDAKACMQGVIGAWNLSPHPALQPFMYRTELVLAGS